MFLSIVVVETSKRSQVPPGEKGMGDHQAAAVLHNTASFPRRHHRNTHVPDTAGRAGTLSARQGAGRRHGPDAMAVALIGLSLAMGIGIVVAGMGLWLPRVP